MKSAFEKAMERADQLGSPSEEERLEWKWLPQGKEAAARYLQGGADLESVLSQSEGVERDYLVRGITEVLVENLRLPRSEVDQRSSERAVKGLLTLKQSRAALEEIIGRVRYVWDQYRQYGAKHQQQAYQELKQHFQAQLEEAIRRQPGIQEQAQQVNVEALPEFREQWLRTIAQLDQQYEQHLGEYREQILKLN